jgi:hypothetical protein
VVKQVANATFLVECFWPDVDPGQVQRAAEHLAKCASQSQRSGARVAYLGSILVTGDDVVFFLFDAESSEEVRSVCEQTQLQFERVVASVISAGH